MVQSWNPAGIQQAFRLLIRPQWTVPHLLVNDIRGIDFNQLYQSGIRGVAFDKDNCLTRPYEDKLADELQEAWQQCQTTFSNHICIVSNSAGTLDDHEYQQAKKVEKDLGVPVLRHQQKKPACAQELCQYFARLNVQPSEIAMIGDRILTDVVYGHRVGAFTILCRKVLGENGDNWAAKHLRRLEHQWLDLVWPTDRNSITNSKWIELANSHCRIVPPEHPVMRQLLKHSFNIK